MSNNINKGDKSLLIMKDIHIQGYSDEKWHDIVTGVDISLNRGEVLGLIGESGAGKSTLGLAALGFARPGCKIIKGEIVFDGIDLIQASEKEKRNLRGSRISYVAQSAAASFNPAHRLIEQTIESSIHYKLKKIPEAREDAKDLFQSLQLPEPHQIGERYPHQVSGGQLQRTMTAMAMSSRPDLIIFDEPTTALDVTTQVEVLSSIRSVVREFNTAAIYITHDLAVVAQMADKIKVLRYGKTVEDAETRQMLSNPKENYTQSLWAVRSIQKKESKSKGTILSLNKIDAAYGNGPKVLKNVNIDVPLGGTLAMVGESGSGKSTAARVITGLLPPLKGNIIYKGHELSENLKNRTKEQLQTIQMVYQSPDTSMNPMHKTLEIIGRPLEFYFGLDKSTLYNRVVELLEMIELDESFIDRYPSELSGGQKQRICIARALAAKPDLVICDEVTSSLDQIVQEGILKLLQKLQKELNISYIFITHDIDTVRAISDQVVVMFEGEVIEQGLKSKIFSPPHPEYTELLLSSVPDMDPDWLTKLLKKRSN